MRPFLRDLIEIPPTRIVVLDVGAMQDGAHCYEPLVEQGLAHVIGVEPDPASRAALERMAPQNTYLPYVLGDGRPSKFHLTHFPGCSSVFEPDPRIINQFTSIGGGEAGNFAVIQSEEVQTRRLDDIDGLPSIDFIKLDVQGGELAILQHAKRALGQACVLQIEVEFVPLYKDQPLFSDVDLFLRDCGFQLHKFVDVAGRSFRPLELPNQFAPYSQLLWADAIYVSSLFSPENCSDAGLLKSALILNDLYASHDLAYRLLGELDRRQGTALALQYLSGLKLSQPLTPKFMNIKDYV